MQQCGQDGNSKGFPFFLRLRSIIFTFVSQASVAHYIHYIRQYIAIFTFVSQASVAQTRLSGTGTVMG